MTRKNAAGTDRDDSDDGSLVVDVRPHLPDCPAGLVAVPLFSSFTYGFGCFSVMVFCPTVCGTGFEAWEPAGLLGAI
jgi:hypothetical protein